MRCLQSLRVMAWLGLVAPLAANAADKPELAVLALRVDTDMPSGTDRTLNEILLAEFHRQGRFEVLGSSDVAAMLEVDSQKMLLGCDEESCVAEIGGALGVSLVAVPSVGAVGDRYVINLKLFDVADVQVLSRVTEYVPRDQSKLIQGIRGAVAQLLSTMGTGEPAPVAETAAPGFMDVAPWVGLGLTVAAAGTGGAFGGLAYKDDQAARDAIHGSADWRNHHDAAQNKALIADVMFGVAGAAAVATLVLLLVDGDESEAAVAAGVAPAAGSGSAALRLRF